MNVDLAEFQAGMARATALANSNTSLMSAQMKRQAKEGAESMRLIDEAIGVHISRPLTRVIAELPGIGSALQSIFALSAGAALGTVLVGSFERLGEKLDEIRDKPFAIAEAWAKVGSTFDSSMAAFDKTIADLETHIATLTGGKVAGLEVGLRNLGTTAAEVAKAVDALFTATEAAQKIDIQGFWDTVWSGIGRVKEAVFTGADSEEFNKLKDHFQSLKLEIDSAFKVDAINKTHDAVVFLNQQLDLEHDKLLELQNLNKVGKSSDEAVALQQQTVSLLAFAAAEAEAGKRADDLKRAQSGLELIAAKRAEVQEALKGWNDEANTFWTNWKKINEEIDKGLEKLKAQAFNESNARAQAQQGQFAPWMTPKVQPPPGAPMLSDQLELLRVTTDQNEAWRKAGEILDQIETPQQKYAGTLAILNQLLHETDQQTGQTRITQDQYTAAVQKAQEALVKAETATERLQLAMQRLEEHSDSASAGFHAFLAQINIEAQKGRFTFDILTAGLHGFEDNLASALTTGKARWSDYFLSLEQMALKFMMNAAINSLFKELSGTSLGKGLGSIFTGATSGAWSERIPGGVAGAAGQAGGTAQFTLAVTTLQTAATTLVSAGTVLATASASLQAAALELRAAATTLQAGAGSGGGAGGFLDLLGFGGGLAGGGDVTPGMTYLVGENGPELLSMGSTASGTITPNSSSGNGNQINIDARGADAGVEQRLMRMIRLSEDRAVMRSITTVGEIKRRTPAS